MSDLLRALLLRNMKARMQMKDAGDFRGTAEAATSTSQDAAEELSAKETSAKDSSAKETSDKGSSAKETSAQETSAKEVVPSGVAEVASEEGGSAEPEIKGKKKKGKKSSTSTKGTQSDTSEKTAKPPGPVRRSSKRGKYAVRNAETTVDNSSSDLEEGTSKEGRELAETERLWREFVRSLQEQNAEKIPERKKGVTVIGKVTYDKFGNKLTVERATMTDDLDDTPEKDGEPQPGTSSAAKKTAKKSKGKKSANPAPTPEQRKGGISILGNDPIAIGLDQANLNKRGLSGLLEAMQGQPEPDEKMGILEKSKADWEALKKEEGLGEELEGHKKSKATHIDKQDFLERADQRQFEIEKDTRAVTRSKKSGN